MTAAPIDFRDRLRAAMARGGFSGRQLEEKAEVSVGTLSRFFSGENQEMKLSIVERLAKALDMPASALLFGEDGGAPRSGVVLIEAARLKPSPLNPRKTEGLDRGAIADLARSIETDGVLQNLVARPAPDGEGFELIAGERRWRAAMLLIEEGRAAADFALPVLVRELDDVALVETALVENVAREAMSPLEEADALAWLQLRVKAGKGGRDVTRRLVEATGKTERWIQKRIKLARDLGETGREALARGDITLSFAQELSELPKAAQAFALGKRAEAKYPADRDLWSNAEKLRATLCRHLPLVSEALFDAGLAAGGTVTHEGVAYFADADEAKRLQAEALEQTRARLSATRAFVEEAEWDWRVMHDFAAAPEDMPESETGAVIVRHARHFMITIRDRLIRRAEDEGTGLLEDGTGEVRSAHEQERRKTAEEIAARRAFALDLREAARRDPAAMLRLDLWAALTQICLPDCFANVVDEGDEESFMARRAAVETALGVAPLDPEPERDAAIAEALRRAPVERLLAAWAAWRIVTDDEAIRAVGGASDLAEMAALLGLDLPPAIAAQVEALNAPAEPGETGSSDEEEPDQE